MGEEDLGEKKEEEVVIGEECDGGEGGRGKGEGGGVSDWEWK